MNRLKRIFINKSGQLRVGWRVAVGIAAGYGTLMALILLMSFAFGKLFEGWGLTNDNLIYAPAFAQQIVFWHTDFTYAAACIVSLLISVRVAKRWTRPAASDGKTIGFGALMGLGLAALLTAAALTLDSMRLERPLSEPEVSLSLISAIVVQTLICAVDEVMGKRMIFDPIRQRFGRLAGFVAVGIVTAAAYPNQMNIFNGFLFGIIGCALYERGGIFASTAMLAGWTVWTKHLFAWPNSSVVSLYRMYTVSDVWLTGGNAGAEAGLGCTLVWMIIAAILLREELKNGIGRMNKRRSTNG